MQVLKLITCLNLVETYGAIHPFLHCVCRENFTAPFYILLTPFFYAFLMFYAITVNECNSLFYELHSFIQYSV